MLQRKAPIAAFGLRFAVILVLLSIPWPGLYPGYASLSRGLAKVAFGWETWPLNVEFDNAPAQPGVDADTRLVIVDPALMNADGSGPIRNLDINFGEYWRGNALLVALVLATPMPPRKKARTLLLALLVLQAWLLVFLACQIWDEAGYLPGAGFSLLRWIFRSGMKEGFVAQVNMAAPVLIWLGFVYRTDF